MKVLDWILLWPPPLFFLVSNDAFDLLYQQNGGCKLSVKSYHMFVHTCIYLFAFLLHTPNSAILLLFFWCTLNLGLCRVKSEGELWRRSQVIFMCLWGSGELGLFLFFFSCWSRKDKILFMQRNLLWRLPSKCFR